MRQISKTQRRLAAGAFLILAAPVALGSVAYACQSLATLHANPSSAPAGGTVTLFGKNYSSNVASSNIEVHLDGRAGQVIASLSPRSIIDNVQITIPAGTAVGTHTLVATQYLSNGSAASGTPGRATVTVTAAARTAAEGTATAAPAAAKASGPVAATPAAATPAAPAAAASAPAAAAANAATAAPAAAAPAAAAAAATVAQATDTAPAAADAAAPGAPAAPAAAAAAEQSTVAPASVTAGLLPASSSESSSTLPGITLAAALALVLLGLGAFVKSGRNLGRSPLAG